jgi:pimeloyl-ACP methyl ester carboxylesterase
VILLPGAVLPADLAYGALLEALGDDVEAVAKELEIYAADEPPPDSVLDVEIDGILRAAQASGFDRFDLVGYSAGGAASLAFAATHPERLRSLALLEPAWAGTQGLDPAEEAAWREYDRINPEVVGSNPTPATRQGPLRRGFLSRGARRLVARAPIGRSAPSW